LDRGLYTFTAVDGGRQASLSGTFYWEILDVDKGEEKTVLTAIAIQRQK
jgi:hypothetical protein